MAMTGVTREEIRVGEMAIRFLVEGGETRGSLAAFEFDVPAGARVPAAHSHDGYDETIYGLEGVMVWTVEGTSTDVAAGGALFVPRGAVHRFENDRDVDAKALAIATPGVIGPEYFRDIAAILDAAGGGPPDFAALAEVMRRHGLTLVR
jgi:quercetin dioxygenase-like cupin family protein